MAFTVMEGPMDSQLNKQNNEYDYHLESNLEDESAMNATTYWFAAAVLFTFLAAGVIVYRTGISNDVPIATQSSPIAPAPVPPHG